MHIYGMKIVPIKHAWTIMKIFAECYAYHFNFWIMIILWKVNFKK